MRFGIVQYLGTKAVKSPEFYAEHIIEQAIWAERYGWDSVVVGEHYSLNEYMPNPLMVAMYIAARTNRIRVGTYIALAPSITR